MQGRTRARKVAKHIFLPCASSFLKAERLKLQKAVAFWTNQNLGAALIGWQYRARSGPHMRPPPSLPIAPPPSAAAVAWHVKGSGGQAVVFIPSELFH